MSKSSSKILSVAGVCRTRLKRKTCYCFASLTRLNHTTQLLQRSTSPVTGSLSVHSQYQKRMLGAWPHADCLLKLLGCGRNYQCVYSTTHNACSVLHRARLKVKHAFLSCEARSTGRVQAAMQIRIDQSRTRELSQREFPMLGHYQVNDVPSA
jgi:hypothetical protein